MTAINQKAVELSEEKENLSDREKANIPAKEEMTKQKEEELIEGLLFAAESKYGEDEQKPIKISRAGKLAFEFNIRPLSEDELMRIRKSSTKYYPNPANRKVPIEGELRYGEFRSKKIYTATVEEKSGVKIWDNTKLRAKLNEKGFDIQESWEIIDKVLFAGEKDSVSDLIDEISGYEMDLTTYAKN